MHYVITPRRFGVVVVLCALLFSYGWLIQGSTSVGLVFALIGILLWGVLIILYKFTDLTPDELLPGEVVVFSTPAGLLMARRNKGSSWVLDYLLPSLALGQLVCNFTSIAGCSLQDYELIQGTLYATTYRIVFKTHRFALSHRTFSLLLRALTNVEVVPRLHGMYQYLHLHTRSRAVIFQVGHAESLKRYCFSATHNNPSHNVRPLIQGYFSKHGISANVSVHSVDRLLRSAMMAFASEQEGMSFSSYCARLDYIGNLLDMLAILDDEEGDKGDSSSNPPGTNGTNGRDERGQFT